MKENPVCNEEPKYSNNCYYNKYDKLKNSLIRPVQL
jgi:hypothetical protein